MTATDLEWGVAARARPGESESGDRYVVVSLQDGALVAVADGLGHGAEAAFAADLAVRTLAANATRTLPELVVLCHVRMRRTRGAALSLARWDAERGTLAWLGVGNVEGVVLQPRAGQDAVCERLLLRGGVVGSHLPELRAATVAVRGDSRLILATDGIAGGFDLGLDPRDRPQALADRIMARPARTPDDAMVLVARIGG